MINDNKLIFENYVDGITRTKNALGGHIMSLVKHGIPSKEEFIKIRQELHDMTNHIEARGTPATDEEKARAHEILAKIKNYRSQHPDDPPPYNKDEEAEDMSKSPFHYDPMHGLASAAHQIRDILKSSANDEARPEHIEKMAEIILGPQSEYASVDHFEKALSGVIELLNHYVVVSMNEYEEMPSKDFNKLKQHINKGPIQIKKPTKELPYTHKYINPLAKQDPREGQREENAEDICIEDLAAKHGVSLEQLQKQLEMGLKVETEHTEDMDVAKKIALDHLNEDPNYYTKLAKMESGSEQEEGNYSKVAHDYAERIVSAGVDDPKALAKHYLDNPNDVPEPLQHDVLKQNFEKILKYIDFTVGLNQRRKKEEEYKKKELEKGPVHPDPEVSLPGSKQARYKPHYKYNPADYLPRQ